MEVTGLYNDKNFKQWSKGDPIPDQTLPLVSILMCTFNGERFLRQQLDSICEQTHENWNILVSDDGSMDGTLEILYEYSERLGSQRLRVIEGPKQGYVENFLHITRAVNFDAQYYAWADQDDIWTIDKIEVALTILKEKCSSIPSLYCSRTQLIDESGVSIGYSKNYRRRPQFLNALVQSISGGNTMVFNQKSLDLLKQTNKNVGVVSHDWWAYQLISGAGGSVHYDSVPRVLYRQHSNNIIGNKKKWRKKLHHLWMVTQGLHSEWNSKNVLALGHMRDYLSEENRAILDTFKTARNEGLRKRVFLILRLGIHRQTLLGNAALCLSVIFKRI